MQEGIAAVLRGPGQELTVEKIYVDDPWDDEILVHVSGSGICRTDLMFLDNSIYLPGVYGHEGAGEVVKVGKNVRKVKPGDHVVMSIVYGCGSCIPCRKGAPMHCVNSKPMASAQRADGSSAMKDASGQPLSFGHACSFANYTIAKENAVVKIDPEMPLEYAGILGCGVQTGSGAVLNAMKPDLFSSIAVYGTGTVGLSAIMAAKVRKCYPIIAVDINPVKLEMAKTMGATHVVNSSEGDPVKAIREIVPSGVDYAVDTVGKSSVTPKVILSTKATGFTVLLGLESMDQTFTIPLYEVININRRIQGVIEGDGIPDICIPQLVSLHQAGELPIDKLLTYYNIKDINRALQEFAAGKTIKPIILFDEA